MKIICIIMCAVIAIDAWDSGNQLAAYGWFILGIYMGYRSLSVKFCRRIDRIGFESLMKDEAYDRGVTYNLKYDSERRRYVDKTIHREFVRYLHGDWT